MAQGWMIIERIENWEVDAASNFAFFGLPARLRRMKAHV
jgi:hypothetical protein